MGTSGYAYPEWTGHFYPTGLSARERLPFYAARLSTVEINATFYRVPTPALAAGWGRQTPDAFVFALKAPRRITHERRLRDVDDTLRLFCHAAAVLGPKRGPLLFQLPPTFRRDTERLRDLLFRLPPDVRAAVEFRHPSWFGDDVYETLRRRDAALCIADTAEGTTPDVATATWGYLRLRDVAYSDSALDAWAARAGRPGWADAFVYFKHEESGAGPALAARLLARLSSPGG